MRRIYLSVIALFLFASGYAQLPSDTYGKEMVRKLSSRSFGGRGYVGRKDAKAAHFIAGQYKKMGLLPLNGNSYLQPYQLEVNYFPGKMDVKMDGARLCPGVDFLIGASSPSVKGEYEILRGQRHDLLDSTGLFGLLARASGQFLLLNGQKDSLETADESKIIDQNIRFLYANPESPIAGLILASPAKLTWTAWPFQGAKSWIEWHQDFGKAFPQKIKINVDGRYDTAYQTQNVCGYVRGTSVPDSFLVITAHYDHLGKMGEKTIFPGANDNASGTAFLLSLAQYYARHPAKYSIAFLAFSGEEIGLKGSEYFVSHPLLDLKKIKFLCNFDMAGTGIDGIQVVNATVFPRQYDSLVAINRREHLLKEVKPRGETRNSDHYWFYSKGVPAFFMYTLGGVNYHDVNDTYTSLPFDAFAGYELLMEKFINQF